MIRFVPEYFPFGSLLRSAWPVKVLNQNGIAATTGDEAAEIIVIHRSLDPGKLELVRNAKRSGLFVIVQEDDDIMHLPALRFGAGFNASDVMRGAKESAKLADRMIVTTPALAAVYSRWCADVRIVPNYLPRWVTELPLRHRRERIDRLEVVYAGSIKGHNHDLDWLRPALPRITAVANLTFIGEKEWPTFLKCEAKVKRWKRMPASYYRALGRFDVGIVPLMPCAFNESKSYLKALDYATQGLEVVATSTGPMLSLECVTNLVETPWEFADRIEAIADVAPITTRQIRREAARRYVLEDHISEWIAALQL